MKPKHIKTVDWRPALLEKATKELFVCAEQCHDAGLYKMEDGRVIYHSYWLTAHGIGPDHCSVLLENIEDLKVLLEEDAELGLISKDKIKKLLEECREYFDE